MAFSEGQEYSSPSKRIKLDLSAHLSNSNVEIDIGSFSAPRKNIHEVIGGTYSVTAEVLNSSDSGFNEVYANTSVENEPSTSTMNEPVECSFKINDELPSTGDIKDDERDEVSSTVSNLSDLSGLSELSGQDWKPTAGPMSWVQKQMLLGSNPRVLLGQLLGDSTAIPPHLDNLTLWKFIVNILSEPPRREKLRHVNTLADVVGLMREARKIIVLTGAGVSVSCGIPDFRSRGGIYSRLALDFPDLPDPQSMFDIQYFRQDPRPFFKFAREIYPGQFTPSPCHRFIKILEKHKKLLRNYSQNIDTLEQVAGIQNVVECHGSFATASCTRCKHKVSADDIRKDIFAQRIPLCPVCHDSTKATSSMNSFDQTREYYKELVSRGVMKPDIVFFGEGLPDLFHDSMAQDKNEVDLLIVIGSSLKVRPVALIPSSIPPNVPQILINREPLPHLDFDVELLGDSDIIINQICHMLGDDWSDVCWLPTPLKETSHLLPSTNPWEEDSLTDTRNIPHVNLPADKTLHGSYREEKNFYLNTAAGMEVDRDSSPAKNCLSTLLEEQNSATESYYTESRVHLTVTKDDYGSEMSVDSGTGSLCSISKERHMSIDSSTRDSGLCVDSPDILEYQATDTLVVSDRTSKLHEAFVENSKQNTIKEKLAHSSKEEALKTPEKMVAGTSKSETRMSVDSMEACGSNRRMSIDSAIDDGNVVTKERLSGGRNGWHSKVKESLAVRLPENSFYLVVPSRYIFPGAEVVCDPCPDLDQSLSSQSENSQSESSDSDSDDNETIDYWSGMANTSKSSTH